MAIQQRRVGKTRKRKRRTHFKLKVEGLATCSNCGTLIPAHTVCPECGYYKGEPAYREDEASPQQSNPRKRKSTKKVDVEVEEPAEKPTKKTAVKKTKKTEKTETEEE